MENLKKEVLTTFKQHPVLTVMSVVCSVYVFSLIALAVIVTVSPESHIGSMVENLF